ncbi:unnamed protein product [Cylindrotheca closterium]|uniref:Uncharacterized protein n=1 Tax=Cylindrotheca closterium TaxID=2856 RepID=A0AAD2CW56_9STRA|nr:unnamed protein product [Cylindrotheca closterium]
MMEKTTSGHQRFIYTTQTIKVPRDVTHASIHEKVQEIRHVTFTGRLELLEVNLNMGLRVLGKAVFKGCLSLKRISVPMTVQIIGYSAFLGCGSLTDVELFEGLEEIADLAFLSCRALQRISIPSTVGTIGNCAFGYCESLVEVSFQDGLFEIKRGAFQYCVGLSRVCIPTTVHTIGESAFAFCTALVEADLNEGLVSIEAAAFQGCTALCAVSIPHTTNVIKDGAFGGCTKLLGVELASSSLFKLELGEAVFLRCNALVNVSIPSAVNKIDNEAIFHGCPLWDDEGTDDPLQDRYANLPIHEACYQASRMTVDDLKTQLAVSSSNEKTCLVDAFGLTPFHIIATSSKLRTDLMSVLLDHYPLEIVSQKDRNEKTMMDYLLAHTSSNANPMIQMVQMVLKYTLNFIMSRWGLKQWRTKIALQMEQRSIEWNHKSVVQILKSLTTFFQAEVTSILELALWKIKIISNSTLQDDPSSRRQEEEKEEVDRESCRMICKADVVISNVVGFLWQDKDESSIISNVLPNSYHIISMAEI